MILHILYQHRRQEISVSSTGIIDFYADNDGNGFRNLRQKTKKAGWQIRLHLSITNKICTKQYEKILFAKEMALEHDLSR